MDLSPFYTQWYGRTDLPGVETISASEKKPNYTPIVNYRLSLTDKNKPAWMQSGMLHWHT